MSSVRTAEQRAYMDMVGTKNLECHNCAYPGADFTQETLWGTPIFVCADAAACLERQSERSRQLVKRIKELQEPCPTCGRP